MSCGGGNMAMERCSKLERRADELEKQVEKLAILVDMLMRHSK